MKSWSSTLELKRFMEERENAAMAPFRAKARSEDFMRVWAASMPGGLPPISEEERELNRLTSDLLRIMNG